MEERIVFGVAGSAGLKHFEGEGEVEPLGDAEFELTGVLHGFEGEEVVPIGKILDGGDAVGESVGDGDSEARRRSSGVGGGIFERRGWWRRFRGGCRWGLRWSRDRSLLRVDREWRR